MRFPQTVEKSHFSAKHCCELIAQSPRRRLRDLLAAPYTSPLHLCACRLLLPTKRTSLAFCGSPVRRDAFQASAAKKQYLAKKPVKLRKISFYCRPEELGFPKGANGVHLLGKRKRNGAFETLPLCGRAKQAQFTLTTNRVRRSIYHEIFRILLSFSSRSQRAHGNGRAVYFFSSKYRRADCLSRSSCAFSPSMPENFVIPRRYVQNWISISFSYRSPL